MNNIELTFLQANDLEMNAGFYWYSDQHVYLKEMSKYFKVPLKVVCGITAALSPGVSWSSNLNYTYHLIKNKGKQPLIKMNGYRKNICKAQNIYKSKKVFPTLKGPKVTEFFKNLFDPLDDQAITVDTFMVSCYYNVTGKNQVLKYYREKNLNTIREDIRKLSLKYNLLPNQFQAIVWLTWHRIVRSMQSYDGQLQLKIF